MSASNRHQVGSGAVAAERGIAMGSQGVAVGDNNDADINTGDRCLASHRGLRRDLTVDDLRQFLSQ